MKKLVVTAEGATLVDLTTEEISARQEEEAAALVTSASSVKAEAQRRIITITGATNLTDCMIKQSNANMQANELNDIRFTRALTQEEEATASALRALAAAIKHVRTKSNEIEAMSPIPSDFANDSYWT
jgi:RNA-binding protein YhbY